MEIWQIRHRVVLCNCYAVAKKTTALLRKINEEFPSNPISKQSELYFPAPLIKIKPSMFITAKTITCKMRKTVLKFSLSKSHTTSHFDNCR